jgi:hypothetical protein
MAVMGPVARGQCGRIQSHQAQVKDACPSRTPVVGGVGAVKRKQAGLKRCGGRADKLAAPDGILTKPRNGEAREILEAAAAARY